MVLSARRLLPGEPVPPEAKPINEILNENLNAWVTDRPGLDLDWP